MENEAMKPGEKEQETAAPAMAETEENKQREESAQTPEENARYAGIRRRAEAQAQKRVDEVCRRQYKGRVNPETGLTVENEADADAYEAAMKRRPPEPSARETQLAYGMQMLTELRETAAREQFARNQLEELRKAFPNCGVTAENMPDELGHRWAALGNLTEAYRLLHFEELQEQQAAAVRQRTLNELRGKRQMKPEQAGANGDEVNEHDLQSLRRMLPGRSDRELRAMLLKVK